MFLFGSFFFVVHSELSILLLTSGLLFEFQHITSVGTELDLVKNARKHHRNR